MTDHLPQTAAVSATDTTEIAARVRAAGSSFYWAMRLMEADRRRGLYAIYAFCREVDDIADSGAAAAEKMAALADWRERVQAIAAGDPEADALDRILAVASQSYGLRRTDFEAVIAGMEMDAQAPPVAPGEDCFDLYCDRVAAAVGRLCVRVFGAPEAAGRDLAAHLGRALQITNIIRDVEEDARMGRLYLPAPVLEQAGIAAREPQAVAADPALPAAKAILARRAAAEFAAAKAALAACETGDLRPAVIMMKVYERLFARLEARDFAPEPRGRLARLRAKADKIRVAARWALKGQAWRDSI